MIAQGIHNVDYKSEAKKNRPRLVEKLPPGLWLPVSVAAVLLGCTNQTVHLLRITGQLDAIRFRRGPLLVNMREKFNEGPLKRKPPKKGTPKKRPDHPANIFGY